jgi:hypothetical protein
MTRTLHEQRLNELKHFARRFRTPHDIQVFLNETPYSSHKLCLSPWRVMEERQAHCAEGAYFAAAIFSFMGMRPLVVDLLAENDDDHIIAPFRVNGYWGAVAKSNTTVLRYREPVYKTLRELVMSYFDMYFNTVGFKSLRGYSRPVSLSRLGGKNWMTSDDDLNFIGDRLTALPHIPLIDKKMRANLAPTDDDLMKACFLNSNEAGLFKPR